jgi:hypothetical protein
VKPRQWRTWLYWLLAAIAAFVLVAGLLALQGYARAAAWTAVGGGGVALLWILAGLWWWRATPWVSRVGLLLAFTAACLFACGTFLAGQRVGGAIAVAGIWAMTVGFIVGVGLLRLLFSGPWAWSAVARTLIDEAVRMKLALVFIVLLLLLVPVLPFLLDADERLQYRVRFFLTWALSGSALLLSLMTIFLSCATVSGDLRERHVFMTLTKPISRGSYLLGKWMGVVMFNLLLVALTGVGIWAFVQILAHSGTAQDAADQRALEEQVLVARVATDPQFPPGMDPEALYQQRLEQLRRDFPDDPAYEQVSPETERSIRAAIVARWYTIGPGRVQGYLFTGLSRAVQLAERGEGRFIQLRLKPIATQPPPDRIVRLMMRINGRDYSRAPLALPHDIYSVLDIPTQAIDDQGRLLVEIANIDDPRQPVTGSVTFSRAEGLQVMYRVGDFTPNLARTLLMLWVRLVFLAMLGVAAASFLDFPVATLLCLMIFAGAVASGFFAQSLQEFGTRPREDLPLWRQLLANFEIIADKWADGDRWEAFKVPIRVAGEFFMLLVPSFARFNPVPLIADGLLVSWTATFKALAWIGIGWTGVTAAAAWLLFRRRELARVTV